MSSLTLYRKRLIPEECILLKNDKIVKQTEDVIITSWDTLNPKSAFQYGASCYFLKEGIKVSKFYRQDGSLYTWYCDIVDYEFTKPDVLVSTDLLVDVSVSPEGCVKVLDLDELTEALDKELLTVEQLKLALLRLDHLLSLIYSGEFEKLQAQLNDLGL